MVEVEEQCIIFSMFVFYCPRELVSQSQALNNLEESWELDEEYIDDLWIVSSLSLIIQYKIKYYFLNDNSYFR